MSHDVRKITVSRRKKKKNDPTTTPNGNFVNIRVADHVRGGIDKNDGRILGQLVDILMRKNSAPR